MHQEGHPVRSDIKQRRGCLSQLGSNTVSATAELPIGSASLTNSDRLLAADHSKDGFTNHTAHGDRRARISKATSEGEAQVREIDRELIKSNMNDSNRPESRF